MGIDIAVPADEEALYRPPADPVLVRVPGFEFAMVDGAGDPNTSPDYALAVQALYTLSYAVVMPLKRRGRPELKVRPLEGLWWADDPAAFLDGDRTAWQWCMMIRQPPDVPRELSDAALGKVLGKVGPDVARRVRVERFEEGLCAQLLHVGPYADEGPNIARLHTFIAEQGLRLTGRHHEIYLSDPRRAKPEKLRTVIRQPCAG